MNYGELKELNTIGKLKNSGYCPKSVKNEMRDNLIKFIQEKKNPFNNIIGFDDTVIPDLQTAILSRHNIILLGLRGQAKTKIARLMVKLLDEFIPVVKGSELNDNPLEPISRYAIDLIKEKGDDTPVEWIHRETRYTEKLATPDVTIADLIGDVDPIKAAALKLPYSDERVIHFGLIPRSHRGIFVINELPDLQARIQVSLFNILEEKDIQIRGFKIRMPLDVQFIFTANPEDYTNRGSIVTPLKDRIDSQILTHYPHNIEISKKITQQEAVLTEAQKENIAIPSLMKELVEQISFEARDSEYVDYKSGVSARLTISAYENMISFAERRLLKNNEEKTMIRISDLSGVIPSVTGKVELVYEGEQEGPAKVAQILVNKAVRTVFKSVYPDPDKVKTNESPNPFQKVIEWFNKGNHTDILRDFSDKEYKSALLKVPGLRETAENLVKIPVNGEIFIYMELLLQGLSEFSLISKSQLERGVQFKDIFSSMFSKEEDEEFDDNQGYY